MRSSRNRDHCSNGSRDRTRSPQCAAGASFFPRNVFAIGVITRVTVEPSTDDPYTIERRAGIWGVPIDPDDPERASPRLDQGAARSMVESLRALPAASVVVPVDPTPAGEAFLTIETKSEQARARAEAKASADTSGAAYRNKRVVLSAVFGLLTT